MAQIFLKILNMSITASWIILAAVLLRCFFKKAPKWIPFTLWGLVALRLILPFSPESSFSLVPSAQVIPQDIVTTQAPAIDSGFSALDSTVNPLITQYSMHSTVSLSDIFSVLAVVWLMGVGIMLLYGTLSYAVLRLRVRASIRYRDNVYICDNVASPFILNIFSPRIYLPSGMDSEQTQHVLAHEYAHIKRLDPLWKPLGFLLLTVYWFNPLMWVAYALLCRDIELACDEKVIAKMDAAGKKSYSQALVACSVHRRTIMACPVAFGELSVKERVKNILSYKKPTLWVILASLAVCIVAAGCFLTNPVSCTHSYTSAISAAPTCTQQGVETFTCQLCQHCYSAPVDALPHSYDHCVVLQEATCVETGLQESSCVCGATQVSAIPTVAHTDGELVITKMPNCTETGEESTTCTYCHAEYVVHILETNQNHDLTDVILTAPTCKTSGEGIHACTRCDYEENCSYEPTGHTFELYTEGLLTCIGQELYYRCTGCGMIRIEYGPGQGDHVWSASGLAIMHCTLCDATKSNENYINYDGSIPVFTGNKPYDPSEPIRIDPPF